MELDIAFSDHHYSKETLVQFGGVISALNSVCSDEEVVAWAFIRYVSDNHPEILSADTPPDVAEEVNRALRDAEIQPVQVEKMSSTGRDDLGQSTDGSQREPEHDRDPEQPRRPLVSVLRWLAVLPASVAGGIVARLLIVLLNRVTLGRYADPDSFLSRLFIEFIGDVVLGSAAVYSGAFVAPRFKTEASVTLAALVLLSSGFLLFPAVLTQNYWAMFSIACISAGGGIAAYGIARGDIEPGGASENR